MSENQAPNLNLALDDIRPPTAGFFRRLVREKPLGAVGGVIVLLLLLTGIFADFLAPFGMNELTGDSLAPPSAEHWLGTDNLGRDMLSRIIYGARVSVIVGLAATTLSSIISVTLGILTGWFSGTFDLIVQRFVDAVMALPWLVLLMVVMSLLGRTMFSLILMMGVVGGITGSRFPRSVVVSIKENVYMRAARSIGCPTRRILMRHVLPNIMAPVIISFTLTVPGVILGEAALSFLGFGVPPPYPTWGGMLSGTARTYMFISPWMALWPGIALSTVVFGIHVFGDAARDLLDPRMRGGAGRYGKRRKLVGGTKGERPIYDAQAAEAPLHDVATRPGDPKHRFFGGTTPNS